MRVILRDPLSHGAQSVSCAILKYLFSYREIISPNGGGNSKQKNA